MTGPDGLPQPRRALAIAAVLSAMALVVLDASVANVALPDIARSLAVAPALAILVVTAYQSALVMALLPCGALGERFGYRRVFAAGVALFTLASALCAVAPSLPWLVAARFLQGLGGAAVMALGVALLRFSTPVDRLGAAIGWNALTVALCSAAGPTVGALVVTGLGWPWLFALNLPLGLAVLTIARALPGARGGGQPLDWTSIGLNALVFAALVAAAEAFPHRPVLTPPLLVAAAAALVLVIRREAPKRAPLVPLDLLRRGSFGVSVVASVCCFTGTTAGLVALPFYLREGLGQTPLAAGLYLTAWPLTVALAASVVGRLSDRVSTALLCVLGGGLTAGGLAALAIWPLEGEPRLLLLFAALCGLGFGLFQTPNNRNMFLSAPPERSGAAGGMQGTARLTGQIAGAALVALLFATTSMAAAPRIALGAGAVLALAAGLVSALRVRPPTPPRGS